MNDNPKYNSLNLYYVTEYRNLYNMLLNQLRMQIKVMWMLKS